KRNLREGIFWRPSGGRRPSVTQWWFQSAVGAGWEAFVLSGVGLQGDDDDAHARNRCSGHHANGPVSSAPHLGLVAVGRCKEVPVPSSPAAARLALYGCAELAATDEAVAALSFVTHCLNGPPLGSRPRSDHAGQ